MVNSYCHCFSNEEAIARGAAKNRSYLACAFVKGQFGAVEFSFRTGYIDNRKEPEYTTFYKVSEDLEDDGETPKKIHIYSKSPLTKDEQKPVEKPFLRDSELYYSYKIDLKLEKLRCMHHHPDDYYRLLRSHELFEEMKTIYAHIFKCSPSDIEGDNFNVLID
ncbi:DUF1187 family protein [Halobacillus sp. KGW1]|uniref:DUF1187 family protein n=1 Tax=Halobacillus sp. KGW1 TaxID=1793726 RepID=UPI00078160C1|nr:DUF1187 family protein [Halobacillus sp. KGW1]